MKRSLVLIVMWLAAMTAARAEVTGSELDAAAAAMQARVVGWRRDFHLHPELGNREFRTSGIVEKHLRSLGLEVRTGIAHTGVVALLHGGLPGPTIMFRADMDALPVTERTDVPFRSTVMAEYRGRQVGVMHACGHDTHTAMLMGAAEVLAGFRKRLPGTVMFVFQPAEEGVPEGEQGGAPLMMQEGLFDIAKPDAIFGLHVVSTLHTGELGVRAGPFMAGSDFFRIVVTGLKAGKASTVTFELLDYFDTVNGISAMMRTTGYSLSLTGQMQVKGIVLAKGTHTPDEAVPFQPYVGGLAKFGVKITTT